MPYIKQEDRSEIDKLLLYTSFNVGELNYIITKLCKRYMKENGEKYKHYNDIIGVLECAKLEFYRRKVSIYEDIKCIKNGDV